MSLTVECFVSKRPVCISRKSCHVMIGLTKAPGNVSRPRPSLPLLISPSQLTPISGEISGDPSLPHEEESRLRGRKDKFNHLLLVVVKGHGAHEWVRLARDPQEVRSPEFPASAGCCAHSTCYSKLQDVGCLFKETLELLWPPTGK